MQCLLGFQQRQLRQFVLLHILLVQVYNTLLLFTYCKNERYCFFFSGTEPILFEGKTEGTIVPARGPKVFGWDAVFEPLGTGLT